MSKSIKMSKLIQVVITSILLIAVFLTITLTWDACTGKATTQTLEEQADEELSSDDEFFEEDYTSDDNYESDTENSSFSDDTGDNTSVDYSDVEDKAQTTSYEEGPSVEQRSSMSGKYLLVAGNFLVESNANAMVNKLIDMGYNSAEVSVFDYSQYYTVIASRSDDYTLAGNLSSELKRKGIDNYVHTRK